MALIAGHVDSAAAGPGALFDLGNLTVGDRLEISDSTSHLSTWVVDAKPESTPKAQLPPALWVTTGPPKLALVTCGGPFDAATGSLRRQRDRLGAPTQPFRNQVIQTR